MKAKFKVGESVVYHRRPTKHRCPYCGYKHNSSKHLADIIVAEIRERLSGDLHCGNCKNIYPFPKGWYQLNARGDIGYYIAAPPTLLEKSRAMK